MDFGILQNIKCAKQHEMQSSLQSRTGSKLTIDSDKHNNSSEHIMRNTLTTATSVLKNVVLRRFSKFAKMLTVAKDKISVVVKGI